MANLNSAAAGTPGAIYPVGALSKGALVCQRATVAVPNTGTGTNLNDTITFFTLPRGATPQEIVLESDQLDSNGAPTLTLDLGSAATPQAYVAAWAGASVAVASNAVGPDRIIVRPGNLAALGAPLAADTTLIVTIHAAAATKAAGNLSLRVNYTIDGLAS